MVLKLLGKFKNGSVSVEDQIQQVVPLSACDSECSSCSTKFPSFIKVETTLPLFDTTSPYKLHCVIPTGKSDWKHSATDTNESVEKEVSKWASKHGPKIMGGNVKVSVSNFALDDGCSFDKNDILLLPFFVWIRKVPANEVNSCLNEVVPKIKQLIDKKSHTLPSQIKKYVIEPSLFQAYIFLCSHKTRDKRCGITAPIMKKEFDNNLRDMGLLRDFGDDRPEGVEVGYINHLGGHNFAANVLVYLKSGEMIWLARMGPANCKPIIEETILGKGKVWADKVRIVQKECGVGW